MINIIMIILATFTVSVMIFYVLATPSVRTFRGGGNGYLPAHIDRRR